MISLLADVNIEGHVELLISLMRGKDWHEFWDHLEIQLLRFHDVGLTNNDTDAVVWQVCQSKHLYLLTNNRNDDGPDSLESTIRAHNNSDSLPIFTLANSESILHSSKHARRVVESLFDHLMRIESLRGTGRLYLP